MPLPGDVITILAALFLLFGIPAILFSLIFLYTGYIRYDANRYLEQLETEQGEKSVESGGATETDRTRIESESQRDAEN
ncbi:hypothetical protein EA462_03970 [Natrarchaeobius halalkaliphilus]|uniref:Uncharacterized protein n=1 Tax=Natrarchaeobius halalkaliphilus TaxID=1679091 RepID=A0A3N6M747_9EURY|nr:hypothetical protein [Natrarchaeobius halalkaliphilus]RQG91161.1 hypothetical protein EA462_03970 [Natrarchaeobius halalkaliphilus]